jgi:Bacterial alpha-L-rhamnosidase 6 hairpin glycosidase domain
MARMWTTALVLIAVFVAPYTAAQNFSGMFRYHSPYLDAVLSRTQPAFLRLAVDSLGNSRLGANLVRQPSSPLQLFEVRHFDGAIEYRPRATRLATPPVWSFRFSERGLRIRSTYTPGSAPQPLVVVFNPWISHATLLGPMNSDETIQLPAILHFPDEGTFRIALSQGKSISLRYDAQRFSSHPDEDYVRVTFPAASLAMPAIEYILDVEDIYPGGARLAGDPRFDGFRRNCLNIFQLAPRRRALANNAASDPCAFTVYLYAAVAQRTPLLAKNLTALDLIRQTLNRYLNGMKGYGMAGYGSTPSQVRYDFLDTYPSLLIAASDYVSSSGDTLWLEQNYPGLARWAAKMVAMEDKDGLLSYAASGDSGSWSGKDPPPLLPANWWDTIGFGHEDAYSNALAYHALQGIAELSSRLHRATDESLYRFNAERIRSVYVKTFYDPATGVLAGWRSADGKLHDYYFTFVNGVAISYGLVPTSLANQIMDHLLAKMRAVGYTHFQYGLPGNLIPIRPDDYVVHTPSWGYNRFQVYENGGATADFAYFTLHALYKLGRRKEADEMLFPLLRAFAQGGFQGKGRNGMTYDWKTWNGTPHGYEGLLTDNYLALLAVLDR